MTFPSLEVKPFTRIKINITYLIIRSQMLFISFPFLESTSRQQTEDKPMPSDKQNRISHKQNRNSFDTELAAVWKRVERGKGEGNTQVLIYSFCKMKIKKCCLIFMLKIGMLVYFKF